ncbi:response regulator [Nitrospirales bacterium NOB]|nr:KDP operon transcriptional regulatory protein KdpE [Nitrospirota bacterium]MDL1890095.1 response regulator [Nitrospirales bacterium NOB]MEB2339259.1 response regulator [Nitrospirales bacterium]QOJ35562.1 MAG: response regulator [Nitrospira sp.]
MTQEASILLIEDEPEIRRFLRTSLPAHGLRLYESSTAKEGLIEAKARNPDLILLDLGLPDLDGSEVIHALRQWTSTPIIVLSARDQEEVKVAALDLGADDYVTKPFGINELLARMRTALRHAARPESEAASSVFTVGNIRVDLGRRQVFVSDSEIHLTPIEYKLLTTLIRYAGKVITHRQLLKEVWGPLHVEEGQYLRVYMRQLRQKIEPDPAQPRYLVTELGVGYRLRTE